MIHFCYAALADFGVKAFLITQGQAVIIGVGLTLGMLYAVTRRHRTKDKRYLDED